jgi:ABC-type transport system involved in multi-copper enzyme maturation permease subunit
VIWRKTVRELWVIALAYLVILEALAIPVLLLWPDIYADLQRSTLFKNIGIDFIKRIGDAVSGRDEDLAYINWCATMLLFRSCNLVATAAAVLIGVGLFARERENSTLEFLLARPVSRGAILWQKVWPSLLVVTVPIFVVNASAIPWSWSIELDLPKWELFLGTLHAAIFAATMLLMTTWTSIVLRVQAHVAAVVGAFVVLQLGVYMTQRIRSYSLFRLVDFDWYGPILCGNTPAWKMFDPVRGPGNTTYLLAACALFYGLSWRALRRTTP